MEKMEPTSHPEPEKLAALIDGALPDTERILIRRHVEVCQNCRHALEEIERVVALLRALPQYAPRGSFLLDESYAKQRPVGSFASVYASLAASVILALGMALSLLIGGYGPDQPEIVLTPEDSRVSQESVQGMAPTVTVSAGMVMPAGVGAGAAPTVTMSLETPSSAFAPSDRSVGSAGSPKNAQGAGSGSQANLASGEQDAVATSTSSSNDYAGTLARAFGALSLGSLLLSFLLFMRTRLYLR